VDDVPYGGGQGMVMKPDPLVAAIEHVAATDRPRRILLAARGVRFDQRRAEMLARDPSLLLVCGRYEGVDERVRAYVDEEVSIGDYVLSGGELAALIVLDAIARLLPGVLGNAASAPDDSFASGLLEHPQFTRPWTFRDVAVPEVLGSGDHGAIRRWRREQALRTTLERRPDLLDVASLDDADRAFLRTLGWPPRLRGGGPVGGGGG
jgi:tRNA (guanine37-N1)-methyltransferase